MSTTLTDFGIDFQRRLKLWEQGYWEVPSGLDTSNFDFSWRPNPYDRPYIHQFGTQWQRTGGPRFVVPESEGVKYQSHQVANRLPHPELFTILNKNPAYLVDFDWSWHPDENEPAFRWIFGNQFFPAEIMPTVEYVVPGATGCKFVSDVRATLKTHPDHWKFLADVQSFDTDWAPHPYEPAYIYVWGNEHLTAAEMPTVEYHQPGATERKYMDDKRAKLQNDPSYWRILHAVCPLTFDWEWAPHPWDPPYIYVWGNNKYSAEYMPTIEYRMPGATERKYMQQGVPELEIDHDRWRVIHPIDKNKFDWSWIPDPRDPPYIYVWGNQYLEGTAMSTVEYHVPGATSKKFIDTHRATLVNDPTCWRINDPIQRDSFDFSWVPHPWDPPYIYIWGNQWHDAITMPTIEYHVPGAVRPKYMHDAKALLEQRPDLFDIKYPVQAGSFDFSWCPNPHSPPYIYVWGNQWYDAVTMPTIEYHVPGATERKYMTDQTPRLQASTEHWVVNANIIPDSFDFSWCPNPHSPPYVYVWGNQWYDAEVMPTIEYRMPGATERKYMTDQSPRLQASTEHWVVNTNITPGSFDFSWCPNPFDQPYIYIWGNQWHDAVTEPTVEYHVPGATQKKYMSDRIAQVPNTTENWRVLIPGARVDFSWRPSPHEPAYIYVWGHKWAPVEIDPAIEYHVPGATERKYIHDQLAELCPDMSNWRVLVAGAEFDWTWRPDPREPAFIYVWGNQWNDAVKEPTVEYHVPGATARKYMHDSVAQVASDRENWHVLVPGAHFDFSWRPDPHSPPYIYVWGNQWNDAETEPTIEYHVPGATERKYMSDQLAKLVPTTEGWKTLIPGVEFDWTWRPNPHSPAYIYVWGNQWHDAATEPTIEYHVPGATERKYMSDRVAQAPVDMKNWQIHELQDYSDFDFSWRPNPHSPPQIYQWADNGPTYTVPGASEVVLMERTQNHSGQHVPRYYIRTTLEDLIAEHPQEVFWAMRNNLDYSNFDWSWRPDSQIFRHLNVFGNKLSKDTQTYFVNGPMYHMGHRDINYVNDLELTDAQDLALSQRIILDMFFVDLGNAENNQAFSELQQRFPEIQRIRYMNSWRDTILRCVKKANTKFIWVVNSRSDYSNFAFDWYPADWQFNMLHVFGTQWSHWGNTYVVNAEIFEQDSQYIEQIEHMPRINHVKNRTIPVRGCMHDLVYVDLGNPESAANLNALNSVSRKVYSVPYTGSYLQTLKQWLQDNPTLLLKRDYNVWLVNSISDYTDFDWSWHCDPYQRDQLHVFAARLGNAKQKFGDTLLVNVSELKNYLDDLEELESYPKKVNYIGHICSTRLMHPVINHACDSQVQAYLDAADESWPFTELRSADAPERPASVAPSVWGGNHATVIVPARGASQVVVPREALGMIRTEMYDYPLIQKQEPLAISRPLDIVFISNGEPIAEANYAHLEKCLRAKNIPNRMVRVKDVNGRVASQYAAANQAQTAWYFLVNGKIQVRDDFDWNWQPDRLQRPKHYIFTATNPVNGLEYGHQAIVANNRELTLNTQPTGLDFTLSSLHESVDINCGVALYNTDAWTTWRTAFREAIKLRANTDDLSRYRLRVWTTVADGDFAQQSLQGARDGVAYYESVSGDLDKLMLSYDWAWIKNHNESLYGK